jgi:ribonuclease HI
MLEVFFDGSCVPNDRTGIPCYAFIVKKDGKTIHSSHGLAGKPNSNEATNSVAEYVALIKALEWLKENGYTSVPEGELSSPLFTSADGAQNPSLQDNIIIKGDSALVVKQVTGKFKVRTPHIKPLYKKAISLTVQFRNLNITLIPRENNSEADRLSYTAYKEVRMGPH